MKHVSKRVGQQASQQASTQANKAGYQVKQARRRAKQSSKQSKATKAKQTEPAKSSKTIQSKSTCQQANKPPKQGKQLGKESKEKGNVGLDRASQVARDWVTIAKACVKHGAVDMSEWSNSNQEMRYLSDRYNCYKQLGVDETDQLIAGDESHKANTQSGIRNTLKKIKDESVREILIKANLLPKPEPIAEGLVMLSKEEHTMIEVIRTYLDGSDAQAVHDWMVIQTGHFSEMMMTQGTAEVQTPPKKKGKKKAA